MIGRLRCQRARQHERGRSSRVIAKRLKRMDNIGFRSAPGFTAAFGSFGCGSAAGSHHDARF
jgi:hypothetical protein